MKLYTLIVHNSDEIKDVYSSYSPSNILEALKMSGYWCDITQRMEDIFNPEDDEDGNETEFNANSLTLDDICELYHDGDSEDGYKLIETELY